MSQGVDAASFEFYEGIRIFIPGAITVSLLTGVGATFDIASLNFTGREIQALLAALIIGLGFYFVDAPAKAAIIRPLQPTEYLRTWKVRPATHSRLNVYLLMLDTEIPAAIRARALYMGSMYRIGFEAIYLILLSALAVFVVSAARSSGAEPNLVRETAIHRLVLAGLAVAAWLFALWRDKTGYSSPKEEHDIVPKRWSWVDALLLAFLGLFTIAALAEAQRSPAWIFSLPPLALAALWAYRYFRGYRAGKGRVPIDVLHAALLAALAVIVVVAVQFMSAPRLSPAEERSWGVLLILALILIVARGHERRLRGAYSSQNTWLAQNKEHVIKTYFTTTPSAPAGRARTGESATGAAGAESAQTDVHPT
jgi:hypothetical protein